MYALLFPTCQVDQIRKKNVSYTIYGIYSILHIYVESSLIQYTVIGFPIHNFDNFRVFYLKTLQNIKNFFIIPKVCCNELSGLCIYSIWPSVQPRVRRTRRDCEYATYFNTNNNSTLRLKCYLYSMWSLLLFTPAALTKQ